MDSLESYAEYNHDWETYEELDRSFEWCLPTQFNISHEICDRWSDTEGNPAIRTVGSSQDSKEYSYSQINSKSNRFANYLTEVGVEQGDHVAIHTTQRLETVVAHLATWKLGAVSVILNPLLSNEELISQVTQTETTVCVLDSAVIEAHNNLKEIAEKLSSVVFVGDSLPFEGESFSEVITDQSSEIRAANTAPEDDAFIVYTSGTTGNPKGVVHSHSTLIGHLPTFHLTFTNLDLEASQTFWSVSNWASITLISNVMTPLFEGRTVLTHARTSQFDPEQALEIITDYNVTNLSASPTALRMIQQIPEVRTRYDFEQLHVITTGGEEVSETLVDWWADMDVTVQEVYGQTEANNVVADCNSLLDVPTEAIGRPIPGHEIAILDPENPGSTVDSNEIGEIAVRVDDPICFNRYWRNQEHTAETVQEGWLLTGDLGYQNTVGDIFFKSRKDDSITTSGYLIGPSEIEDVLVTHSAVADAGVIGIEDEVRGEIPKAFVKLSTDTNPSTPLITELQEHVKERTAKYKYPREIEIIDTIPKTNTGTTARGELREIDSEQFNPEQ